MNYIALLGVITTMNIMFLKHSKSLSNDQKASITKNFMLVFSNQEDLQEINESRIAQDIEDMEK